MMHQVILALCVLSIMWSAQVSSLHSDPLQAVQLTLPLTPTGSHPAQPILHPLPHAYWLFELSSSKQELFVLSTAVLTASAASTETSTTTVVQPKSKFRETLKQILPILASAFCAAAIMYPLDVVRSLQMANAGSGLTTKELLVNFHKAHAFSPKD